jgi:hypothetical protein
MDDGWVRQVMGSFEVGGGDEGADFSVQVKAELDLHLIGRLGHPQAA